MSKSFRTFVVVGILALAALAAAGAIHLEATDLIGLTVVGSLSVDQAFIKQYEGEVHAAFQRKGSKLRGFVRRSTKSPGQDIFFPKIGKGQATSKPRHGDVEPMNISHDGVTVTLVDRYAPEYIDKFDQFKTNIDLQKDYAEASAWTLGRETDAQIVAALDSATQNTNINLSAITTYELTKWLARLWNRDVPPGDGELFVAVSPMVWAKLMTLQEFANSQWIGPEDLPFKTRMEAKYWNQATWISFTGLGGNASGRKCTAWHRTAIGHGIGADVMTEINYIPQKVSTLVNSMMSMGAVLIDDDGVERLTVNETA